MNVRSEDGKLSLFYQTFDEMHMIDEKHVEKWRVNMKEMYSNVFGKPVKVDLHFKQRPDKRIKPMDIAFAVCEEVGQDPNDVLESKNARKFVITKMFINQIIIDAGYTPAEIEEAMPWKNRLYAYYRTQLSNLFYSQPHERKRYEQVKEKVMHKLFK